jgi:hypothetical protein
MEIIIGIVSIVLTILGVYIAYLQLKRTPETTGMSPVSMVQNAISDLNSTDPSIRKNAVKTLSEIQHKTAIEALIRATNHPMLDVQMNAIVALGTFQDENGIHAIESAFRKTSDKNIKESVVESLSHSHFRSSLDLLVSALNEPEGKTAYKAAEVLVNHPVFSKDIGIIKSLILLWSTHEEPVFRFYSYLERLREKTINVIVEMGEKSIPELLKSAHEIKIYSLPQRTRAHILICKILNVLHFSDKNFLDLYN